MALGLRTVPVVARGEQYVFAMNLEDVAEFVGLQGTGHTPLPPEQLLEKWILVLQAAQRLVRQLSPVQLAENVIANRERSIRLLAHHVFRVGGAFLDTVERDAEYTNALATVPPPEGGCLSGDELAAYGEEVIALIQQWWDGLEDRSCSRKVPTFIGPLPTHLLFERSTWHSAQHTRQLASVIERFSIQPDRPLTAEDLAGLPMPERLWE